jgi:hypothetical protein
MNKVTSKVRSGAPCLDNSGHVIPVYVRDLAV